MPLKNIKNFIYIFCLFFLWKNSFALESLSYSGRLVQASGAPVAGPVKIRADLAYTNATGSVLCTDEISSVTLSKGVFHVKIDFDCSLSGKTLTQVLSQTPAGHSVAIQITDITDGRPPKSYSFQALHALPFATVASQLVQMGANDGEFLKWNDTDKKWEAGNVSGASGGTVTNVTATSPLSVTSGATTPALTISQANGTTSGYLSSADWNTFNNKEGTLTGGTATQYYRGDKTWQTLDTSAVPENVNLYFTNARVLGLPLTGFSATNSAIVATDTVVQGFSKAQGQINTLNTAAGTFLVKNNSDVITGTVNVGATGFLTISNPPSILTDATNKQYVDNNDNLKVNKAGDTVSGVLTLDNDFKVKGGPGYVTVKGHASSANYDFVLPSSAGTSGHVLQTDGSGNLSWINPSSVAAGSGTVNSASITDGSIVDADINASAGIAQSKIAGLTTALSGKESTITAGTTSQYYRGDKTFVDLGTDVRGTQLTGYSVGANTALIATDTTLSAFQKVQGQIDATNTVVAGKEPTLANPSDTTKYYRGDKSWQTLDGGAVANSAAGNIAATNVQSALNELDSEKQANITSTSSLSARELRFYELTGNGTNYTSLKSPDDLTATINYVFPSTAPSAGQVLSSDALGVMSWISIPSAPVASTFGRTGVVTATAGDYNATQITNTPAGSIAATNVQAALNELDSEKEPLLVNPSDTTKYYRGDKTWSTFATDTINSVLSTFSLNAGSKPAVTNTDTVVGAFGKVQKTLNDINADYVSKTLNQTINGTLAINSATGFITVPTPINPNDAVNKSYVDGFGQWIQGLGAYSGDIYRSSGKVGIGTNAPSVSLDIGSKTDALALPKGTTAEQPASPVAGWLRYNTTNSLVEVYNGSSWTSIGQTGSAVDPAGMISAFPMATCPSGWLEANGATVSTTTYASLFAAVGYTYGGSGATFKLPDYRGYFLRGWSHGSGSDPDSASRTNRGDGTTGDNVGTLQSNQYSSHVHGVTDPGHAHNVSLSGENDPGPNLAANPGGSWWYNSVTRASSTSGTGISIQNSGGNETRPKNINVTYCVSTATNTATTVASTGSGTANYLPMWTSTTALGNSPIAMNGSNVGIGTTVTPQKLSLYGSSVSGGAAQTNISAYAGNGMNITGSIANATQDAITYSSGSGGGAAIAFRRGGSYDTYLDFYTNAAATSGAITQAMTINHLGSVGIGTNAPTNTLNVSNTAAFNPSANVSSAVMVGPPGGTAFGGGVLMKDGTYYGGMWMNGNGTHLVLASGGTTGGFAASNQVSFYSGNISAPGCVIYNGGTSGTCLSDRRLKKDIKPFDLGLDKLIKINPVSYKYNGLGENKADTNARLGVIAQDVEKVAPELVVRRQVYLHEGDKEKTEVKAVNYNSFTYMLINAIKELYGKWKSDHEQIEKQKREIASLKSENEELKIRTLKNEKENAEIKKRLDRLEKKSN